MKFLVIFALFALFAVTLADIPDTLREELKRKREICQANPATAVNADELRAYRDSRGTGKRPENMGQHSLCMSKEMGWQNQDGTINKDRLREMISRDQTDNAKVEEMMNKCAIEKENALATAEHLMRCLIF